MSSIGVAMLALAFFVRTKKKGSGNEPQMYSDAANMERELSDNPLIRAASSISIRITETASKAFVAATEIEPDHSQDEGYYDSEYKPPAETELAPTTPTRRAVVPQDPFAPATTSPPSVKKPAPAASPPRSPRRLTPFAVPKPAPVIHPEVVETATTTSRIYVTVSSNSNANAAAAPAPKPPTKKKSWFGSRRKSKG
jgi:hypothetical protein